MPWSTCASCVEQLCDVPLALGELREQGGEVVALDPLRVVVTGRGGIPRLGQRDRERLAGEVLADRPVDDLPDDDAERHRVGAPARELLGEAEEDGLHDVVGRVGVAELDLAALADQMELAREKRLVVAGLEESPVFCIAGIVHRRKSLWRHGLILRP